MAKKKKFSVTVQRTVVEEATFEVRAEDEKDAEEQAKALAEDHDFGSGNTEYEATSVEEV